MRPVELVLASRSPRRADLLRAAGIAFRPGPFPDVDETPPAGLSPPEAARALAERKVRAAASRARGHRVLAADTVVFLGDEILGKPGDPAEARHTLLRLSGRVHQVATGVALAWAGEVASEVAMATVTFRALDPAEVDAYVATGEPLGKAGAYAIQGGAERFVEALEGDFDTVVGLPVALVRRLLARAEGGLGPPPAPGR